MKGLCCLPVLSGHSGLCLAWMPLALSTAANSAEGYQVIAVLGLILVWTSLYLPVAATSFRRSSIVDRIAGKVIPRTVSETPNKRSSAVFASHRDGRKYV